MFIPFGYTIQCYYCPDGEPVDLLFVQWGEIMDILITDEQGILGEVHHIIGRCVTREAIVPDVGICLPRFITDCEKEFREKSRNVMRIIVCFID